MRSSAHWERPSGARTWWATSRRAEVIRRHLGVGALALLATLAFQFAFAEMPPERAWNRALADAALVLFGLTMASGALVRLRGGHLLFSVRRELGLWSAILAGGHVLVVALVWLDVRSGDLVRDAGYAMGNLVGVVALAYTLLLAVTSNDYAQRRLGASWTHLQRAAITCYVLVALHSAYFLFLEAGGAGPLAPPRWLRLGFLAGVAALVALRTAAFLVTAARVLRRTAP